LGWWWSVWFVVFLGGEGLEQRSGGGSGAGGRGEGLVGTLEEPHAIIK
jgi:hypothetical protein